VGFCLGLAGGHVDRMNPGLTSFRAFAFLAVYLYHAHVLSVGYLGVQAFFVLSGFLLTPILIDMKQSMSTRHYFTKFYGRRALRIFPLYYLYLGIVALYCLRLMMRAQFEFEPVSAAYFNELPWALTYTYNFFNAAHPEQVTPLLSHFWSLAVEEQFYLVWPLILLATPKRWLKTMLLVFIAMGPLLRILVASLWGTKVVPGIQGPVELAVYLLPFSHLDAFALGGFFALFRTSISKAAALRLLLAVVALGLCSEYLANGQIRDWTGLGYMPLMLDSGKSIWGYSVLNVAFGCILLQVRDGKFLRLLFENRVVRYLGEISYGLYVFHFIVLGYYTLYHPEYSANKRMVVALLVTILLSAISYELMEKRFIRMKDRIFAR
jgi:peptidoglycan/LPS O-acetylase OafA/YrhL